MNTKHLSKVRNLSVLLLLAINASWADKAWSQRPPLKVVMYESLSAGVSESRAIAASDPLVRIIEDNIKYPVSFELYKTPPNANKAQSLHKFGKKLDDGVYHLGIMWGMEYYKLRKDFPQLKAMIVCTLGKQLLPYSELLVFRKENAPVPKLAQLKGQTLTVAQFETVSLPNELFLAHLMNAPARPQKKRLGITLKPLKIRYPTAAGALHAVMTGKADAIVLDKDTFAHWGRTRQVLADRFVAIVRSSEYSPPVVIGNSQKIDDLREGMWSVTQKSWCDIQNNIADRNVAEQFKQLKVFWGIEEFLRPKEYKNFEKLLKKLPN